MGSSKKEVRAAKTPAVNVKIRPKRLNEAYAVERIFY